MMRAKVDDTCSIPFYIKKEKKEEKMRKDLLFSLSLIFSFPEGAHWSPVWHGCSLHGLEADTKGPQPTETCQQGQLDHTGE